MQLEDRLVLSNVFQVTSLEDDGPGTLRAAIEQALNDPDPDPNTIQFESTLSGTIVLATRLPDLDDEQHLTINGPGAHAVTVARDDWFSVFTIPDGRQVSLSGLKLTQQQFSIHRGITNRGTLTLTDVTVSDLNGGGILNDGTLEIVASTIENNEGDFGGGLRNLGGSVTIRDSTFRENVGGTAGGAVYNHAGTITVTNSTFSGNKAFEEGGGLINDGTLLMTHVTVTGNQLGGVGGGNLELTNTIVDSTSGPTIIRASQFTSGGHNLFSDTPAVTLDATDLVNTDPMLAELADNGGPTWTHALPPGSPAVDVIAGPPLVATDQRGVIRPQGTASDIGAFELEVKLPPPDEGLIVTTLVDEIQSNGQVSLREAIAYANSHPGADTITFADDLSGDIRLLIGTLELSSEVGIQGPGADTISVVAGVSPAHVFSVSTDAVANIFGLTIAEGAATNGGGIWNQGDLTVSNVLLRDNEANVAGGAIWNSGTLHVVESTVADNVANKRGGGIENEGGTVGIVRSTFHSNDADDDFQLEGLGGAVHSGGGQVLVQNSTFSGNGADYRGGAIASSSGTVNIGYSTFTGNSVGREDGQGNSVFFTGGTLGFTSSIFADPRGIRWQLPFSTSNFGHNLFIDESSFAGPTDLTNTDPQLEPLTQRNGWPTPVHPLALTSPAIDQGNPDFATSTDQRGMSRPQGDGPDIGAFELSPADFGLLVTTLEDEDDPNNTETSLREAIVNARQIAGEFPIAFADDLAGPINLDSPLPELTGTLVIQGPGADFITVARQEDAAEFGILKVVPGADVEVSGLTITKGLAETGGGISNQGTLELYEVILTGNSATLSGGGIFNQGGTVTVTASTIRDNSGNTDNKLRGGGGGLSNIEGTVTIEADSQLINNWAHQAAGGILNYQGTLVVNESTLTGNQAPFGGGIWNIGTVTLTGATLSENKAEGVDGAAGGGIVNRGPTSKIEIRNSTIEGNTADFGAGIHNSEEGEIQVFDSTLRDNRADRFGGGIRNQQGTVEMTGSTLVLNTAVFGGGGIHNFEGTLDAANSTFSGNLAPEGDDLRNAANGQSALIHVTFGGNTEDSDSDVWNAGELALVATLFDAGERTSLINDGGVVGSLGANLFSDDPEATNPGLELAATDLVNSTPMLGPLEDNGGPTLTHALLPGSPALHQITATTLPRDQRGVARPQGAGTDIGAFELEAERDSLTVTTLKDVIDPFDYETSLREAIIYANQSPLSADTIRFERGLGGTLLLDEALPDLSTDMRIQGPGTIQLTIERAPRSPEFGIFTVTHAADVAIESMTIAGGTAEQGGAIANLGSGTLMVLAAELRDNMAQRGGALFNSGNLIVLHSTLARNQAVKGGGLYSEQGDVQFGFSTLHSNAADRWGGAMAIVSGSVTLGNVTVSDNTAGIHGGGIVNENGDLNVVFATFYENTAPLGGGITSSGEKGKVTLKNSIVAASSHDTDTVVLIAGEFDSGGYNLFSDLPDLPLLKSDQTNTDPRLLVLANNGGRTLTHALSSGSPARDAAVLVTGPPFPTPEIPHLPTGLDVDQRGVHRPQGPAPDIGAFELVVEKVPPPPTPVTLIVTTLDDIIDANDNELSLHEAIAMANEQLDSDTIGFEDGLEGIIELQTPLPQLNTNMTIVGPGEDVIGITSWFQFGVLFVNSNVMAAISGLKVMGGAAEAGGAIHNKGSLTLTEMAFEANVAGFGGAVRNDAGASLVVESSRFYGNVADQQGGAISDSGRRLEIDDTYFSANRIDEDPGGDPEDAAGGALATEFNQLVQISSSTFVGNKSLVAGGAIYSNESQLSLTDSRFISNWTFGANSQGGAIAIDGGIAGLENCTLQTNTSTYRGGGLSSNHFGRVTLVNSTFSENESPEGGGIATSNGANVNLQHVTFSGNQATNGGGLLVGLRGSATAMNSLFDQDSDSGGSVHVSGLDAQFVSDGNNLFRDDPDVELSSTDLTDTDPMLEPLKYVGGKTAVHPLKPRSPAFDAAELVEDVTTDQRGVARPQGMHPDIGSYEFDTLEPASLIVTTLRDIIDPLDHWTSLREAIIYANAEPGADTITFAPDLDLSDAMYAGSTFPTIRDDLTIDGPDSGSLRITRGGLGPPLPAFRFFTVSPGAQVAISELVLEGGELPLGGAIYNEGHLIVSGVWFRSNSADQGGAIYNDLGVLIVKGTTFSGNSATDAGGAIANTEGSILRVVNSTFSGNIAIEGGALYNAVSGDAELTHVTFSDNTSGSGGDLWNAGELTLSATLFDAGDDTSLVNDGGTVISLGNNLFSDDPEATNPGLDLLISDHVNTAPLLEPLADNGGPTWTHAVPLDSPAANVISGPPLVPTDQRGVTRPQGPRSDIGAFEVRGEQGGLIVTTLDDVVDPFDHETSLREAVAYANQKPLSADTIRFERGLTGTLLLGEALPDLSTDMTIEGPGTGRLTVERREGSPAFRIFTVTNGADVTIEEMTVAGGLADKGGAIANLGGGTLTVLAAEIRDNEAQLGGALFNQGTLYVLHSTLASNHAVTGGALYSEEADVALGFSTLHNNSADEVGGGMAIVSGHVALGNVTISGNTAGVRGGGIVNENADLDIAFTTLFENTAPQVGGILSFGSKGRVTLKNSIVAGSTGAVTIDVPEGEFVSGGHNLFSDRPNVTLLRTDKPDTDPGLLPLANNGGRTMTHALSSLSEARDAAVLVTGPPFPSPEIPHLPTGLDVDQRGVHRPQGPAPDIGAFELVVEKLPPPPTPATLIVTTLDDIVDASDNELSLREAITQANELPDGDAIGFQDGLWGIMTLTRELPSLNTDMTIIGPGEDIVAIARSQEPDTPEFRILSVNAGVTAAISGLRLTGGKADLGAAIFNRGALTVSGMNFTQNVAGGAGGAVRNDYGASLTVENSLFLDNRAGDFAANDGRPGWIRGGAIADCGLALAIAGSFFSDNDGGSLGGAISTVSNRDVLITESQFYRNRSEFRGGAIHAEGSSLELVDSTWNENSVTVDNSAGGAIAILDGTYSLRNSTFNNNHAEASGGGLWDASRWGTIVNSTFSANDAGQEGGAISHSSDEPLVLTHATLFMNEAPFGGGIASRNGEIVLANTIIDQQPGISSLQVNGGDVTSEGYNIFSDDPQTLNAGLVLPDTDQIDTDPLLEPLAQNGWPTAVHALQPYSPAIGNAGTIVDATTDQRGVARPQGLRPDIGAFELDIPEPQTLVVTTLEDLVDPFDYRTSLREAIGYANAKPGADTITFAADLDLSEPMNVGAEFPTLTTDLTIEGPETGLVQISRTGFFPQPSFRFFTVSAEATVAISGLELTGGQAVEGGAIFNAGNLTVSQVAFERNTAESGGAIFHSQGTLTVLESAFVDNTALAEGAGIFQALTGAAAASTAEAALLKLGNGIDPAGVTTIANSTFSGNTASLAGGAIANLGGEMEVAFVTFSNNNALINNKAFSNNHASHGGSLYNATRSGSPASTTIGFNIFDAGAGGSIVNDAGTVISAGYNLFSDDPAGPGITLVETDLTNRSAQLGPLGDHGGLTPTHVPEPGSPAVNAVMRDVGQITDQRGVARPQGIFADIGAVEVADVEPASLIVTILEDRIDAFDRETSLREAVTFSNFQKGRDTITFRDGLAGTIWLPTALPDLSDSVTITGPGAKVITVARGSTARINVPEFSVFEIKESRDVTITGLTIRGGDAEGSLSAGGGIHNVQGDLTLQDVVLVENTAFLGGGLWSGPDSTLLLTDVLFADNIAVGAGGGLLNAGGIATLVNTSFVLNMAPGVAGEGGLGGGIANGGTLTLDGGSFRMNQSRYGGAIYNEVGTVQLVRTSLTANEALDGGGIVNVDGQLDVVDSTLHDNTATGSGGGILNTGVLTISGSTLSENVAHANGGGILHALGLLTVANSTFSGNSVSGAGGAIASYLGETSLTHVTLRGNHAELGGGVANSGLPDFIVPPPLPRLTPSATRQTNDAIIPGQLTINNSLFDAGAGGSLHNVSGIIPTGGYNLFSDDPIAQGLPLDPAHNLVNQTLLLGPLADNGGPTATHELLEGSPAIDRTDPWPGIASDQRRVPRPQGARPDVGAFEYVPPLKAESLVVNGGGVQRSNIDRLVVHFDQASNLQELINDGTISQAVRLIGTDPVELDASRYRYDPEQYALTIDVTVDGFGDSLKTMLTDGQYQVRIDAAMVKGDKWWGKPLVDDDDEPDGWRTFDFHLLRGDFDGSAMVDLNDRDDFFAHYGSATGHKRYDAAFDLDASGVINIADYLTWTRLLRRRL